MSLITCTRRIQFCAGHRVLGHEGHCANLHGHNYVAFITAEAEQLDNVGRVVDFSVLKQHVGGWIDREWDHGFIANRYDEQAVAAVTATQPHKLYLLPDNPTAENLADYLLTVVCPKVLAGLDITVTSVTIHETENCYATAALRHQ